MRTLWALISAGPFWDFSLFVFYSPHASRLNSVLHGDCFELMLASIRATQRARFTRRRSPMTALAST
jgi:hypothetical protein